MPANFGPGWILFFLSALLWGLVEGYVIRVSEKSPMAFGLSIAMGLAFAVAALLYFIGLRLSPTNLGLIVVFWDFIAFIGGVVGYNVNDLPKLVDFINPVLLWGWLCILLGGGSLMWGWKLLEAAVK